MKKATTLALALFTTAALAGTANAATPAPGPHRHHGVNADRIVQHMNKDLNLSADQQSALKTIFQEQGQKMRALREQTRSKINQVLTPEQQAKAKQLREERIKKFKEKRAEWKKEHAKK